MDHLKALALFKKEILRESAGVSTRFPDYIRFVEADYAIVTGSTLTNENVDEAIRVEVEFFRNLDREFEWKVYNWDAPGSLKQSLLQNGFVEGDEEAIMIFNLDQDYEQWGQSVAHEVFKVSTDAHVEDYRSVERTLGSDHGHLNEIIDSLQKGTSDAIGFVVYTGQQPVSIARLYCLPESKFGGCYGGSTLPEFRKRGCYRALVLARAREAKRLGLEYLQVDSLPTSKPILERLGFYQIGSTWPFTWSPGGKSAGELS